MDSETILNTNLEKLFYKEVEELRKVKGDSSAIRLMMGLSRLNCLNSPEIVQVFQEEGSGLVLELLLAVIGYDPAAKEFVRPIDEREFELLDSLRKGDEKDQRIFYALIYDREITFDSVKIIKQTRGELYLSDLLLISNVKDKTGLGINDLIQGHYANYIYLQSLEILSEKEKRDLDGLTFLMADTNLQIVFCCLSSEYGQISQIGRHMLKIAATALARGELSIAQFEELFGMFYEHTSGEIIKKMNSFIAERTSCE